MTIIRPRALFPLPMILMPRAKTPEQKYPRANACKVTAIHKKATADFHGQNHSQEEKSSLLKGIKVPNLSNPLPQNPKSPDFVGFYSSPFA